jgi:hypothetical protein
MKNYKTKMEAEVKVSWNFIKKTKGRQITSNKIEESLIEQRI